ncbi:hypothetical protein DTO166G4_485 [Paecilomyces variotii]|nr:hypothetical protein DTO166G4_485 [Paecilomyces variotii]KAJ9235052.1 hypothetical protein DTO166G5_4873 [Paecilomyces variotii]KAJ9244242.1 hypothetical protein DTO169E5_1847 [Paecilomyces variotii]KAJ9378965.1 hypothetical protein DTO063F5_7410 [Paecilomyces variotii]
MTQAGEDSKVPGFFVPCDLEDLEDLVTTARMKNMSLYNLRDEWLESGSNVTQKQFVAFRAIWPAMKDSLDISTTDAHLYGIDEVWNDAQVITNNLPEFQKFLDMTGSRTPLKSLGRSDNRHPSSLAAVRDLHELVGFDTREPRRSGRYKRSPSVTELEPSYARRTLKRVRKNARGSVMQAFNHRSSHDTAERPRAESQPEQEIAPRVPDKPLEAPDEPTVNAALVIFLRSFSNLVRESKFEFFFQRVLFTPTFGKRSFTAYTDGAFRSLEQIPEQVLAILEVKKASRESKWMSIQMQETAEMVGWLMTSTIDQKFMNNHPVIISQDYNELYITFASYHQDYLDYLKKENAKVTENTYLSLQTYGPFVTEYRDDMERFATLIVAMTLAAN